MAAEESAMTLLLVVAFTFHLTVTDAKTALLANPSFEQLHMPAVQLERAANDRVVMLDRTTGAHWVWLMFSWRPGKEQLFNTRGSGNRDEDSDVGITANENGTIRIRCLH